MIPASHRLLGAGVRALGEAASSPPTLLRRGLPHRVRAAVLRRDGNTCRWCGFYDDKYLQMIRLGERLELDHLVTACVFCHQAFHLDLVPDMRSGFLVLLPELDQVELNRVGREIYVARIARDPELKEKAARGLEILKARRQGLTERFGFANTAGLVSLLRSADSGDERLSDALGVVRLAPRDRRIQTEADLEFNQFPPILARWRRPYRVGGTIGSERLEAFLALDLGESAPNGSST